VSPIGQDLIPTFSEGEGHQHTALAYLIFIKSNQFSINAGYRFEVDEVE